MYADVVVDGKGPHTNRVFTYHIPPSLSASLAIGSTVTVPFGKRRVDGWVVAKKRTSSIKSKPILTLRFPDPVLPKTHIKLAFWMRAYYHTTLPEVFKTISLFRAPIRRPQVLSRKTPPQFNPTQEKQLTQHQSRAIQEVTAAFDTPSTFLLHGITGSGKTEVYLQIIEKLFTRTSTAPKNVIILVPEISLTPQTVQRFSERFPGLVDVWHSQLSRGEQYAVWRRIHDGDIRILVGSRSAIFAPFARLNLIIIDEEHDASYKQDTSPRYDARTVARWLSKTHQCPILAGSATPRIETFLRAKRLTLPSRIGTVRLPSITIVDMREELRAGNRSPISGLLEDAISARLARHQQTILFLNRRGQATAMLCRACGFVLRCANCDVAMTVHQGRRLQCHHCNAHRVAPETCPKCDDATFYPFGAGTQRIEAMIKHQFQNARVERMDRDTTTRKGSHTRIYQSMRDGNIDILIGTQMVTKGWDIPNVTLVGILAADLALTIPDFSATETTMQLLMQVAGRAGRGEYPGNVVVQTYNPHHPVIQAIQHHDYLLFLKQELQERKRFSYPPFVLMAKVSFSHKKENVAHNRVQKILEQLQSSKLNRGIKLLGPTPTLIPKRRGLFTSMLIIKARSRPALDALLQQIPPEYTIDVDPIRLI